MSPGFLLSGGEPVSRYPAQMTRTDWVIAFAMACPFAAFFLLVAAIWVFG